MGEDILFRNSLFGFNKEDVIAYIAGLKEESEQRLAQMQVSAENDVKNILDEVEEDEKLKSVRDLKKQIKLLNSEIEGHKQKISELENKCEKFHKVEDQLGSMILDAYICSENIIYDAKARTEQLTQDTSETIVQTVDNINEYSKYIDEISNGFNEIVANLTHHMKSISESLINATKSLRESEAEQEDAYDYPDINDYINGLVYDGAEPPADYDSSMLFEYEPEKPGENNTENS